MENLQASKEVIYRRKKFVNKIEKCYKKFNFLL